MTEIIPAPETGALSLPEQWRFAETVADSGIVPKAYKGDAGGVLVAVNLGAAMGLSPAESLYRIHVIEGKPSASAELITSNVRRAGHKLRIKGDAQKAVVQIIRADDPDWTYEVTWTMQDAQRAGLASKSVWKSYPAAMLRSRAITECARQACPEALYGVIYTDEEAREGLSETVEARPRRESAASLLTQAAPAVEQEAPVPAEANASTPEGQDTPAEAPVLMVTKAQLAKIAAQMRDLDITERDHALGYIEKAIGLKIASRSELTREEAKRLIDALDEDITQANGDTDATTSSPDGNAES